ncbi:MAG: ATP-binding cassette domain-containing protein [Candidatus ainarchaeum sp.]|nr:ATP-binding cassette domain-containing protein [Candidatus ainarchaeum sp.]
MKKEEKKIISIKGLKKTFKTKVTKPGMSGIFKNIFSPDYKYIKAVDNIYLDIKEGELVSFIGPNGAGKSTTLKMLSGILFPDSGKIKILGKDPSKKRKELSYDIGTIFGQKPQLWFHLPPIDSFNLFAKIYDLDKKIYQERLKNLINLFEISDIINQPVRKLSLGQRMRCEFVLALLHNPKILFLDEPTIGMDIIVKKTMRELIKKINEKEKTTIILTSHDIGDIENISTRLVIINHGQIVYDGDFKNIKQKYLSKKLLKITTEDKIDLKDFKDLIVIKKSKYYIEFEINTKKFPLNKVIDFLFTKYKITDIGINEMPIEDVIEEIYRDQR